MIVYLSVVSPWLINKFLFDLFWSMMIIRHWSCFLVVSNTLLKLNIRILLLTTILSWWSDLGTLTHVYVFMQVLVLYGHSAACTSTWIHQSNPIISKSIMLRLLYITSTSNWHILTPRIKFGHSMFCGFWQITSLNLI